MNHRPGFGAFPLSGERPETAEFFGAHMGRSVKITVTESACRSGFHTKGQTFTVDADQTVCPPVCMELWHAVYPYVFALRNGAALDYGDERAMCFDAQCPDGGRVRVHGEAVAEKTE